MLGRLKFDIDSLVNQMLDQVPKDVIINGTIFDPAIGGGQFVKEVERRKRAAGKTDAEIANTVFGIEQNILRKNYAVNKHKLVGNYTVDNFLEKDFKNMKFDVIVGNPPYQDGTKDGGQNKIYNQFCKKSLDLLNPDGTLAFVTPTSVLKESKRFSLIGLEGLKLVDFRADSYFDVGINICWWLVDRTYRDNKVTVINNDGCSTQSRNEVVYDYSSVDEQFSKIYQALKKATDTPDKRMFKQNNFGPALSKTKTTDHTYSLHKLEDNQVKLTYWSSRKPYYDKDNKLSIGMTKSLSENAFYSGKENFDPGYMTTKVSNVAEIKNIKSFILSPYFIDHCEKWKSLDGYGYNYGLKYLPPFDTSKQWTDDEVKNFIESYVK